MVAQYITMISLFISIGPEGQQKFGVSKNNPKEKGLRYKITYEYDIYVRWSDSCQEFMSYLVLRQELVVVNIHSACVVLERLFVAWGRYNSLCPQHFNILREAIHAPRWPQFVVAKGHSITIVSKRLNQNSKFWFKIVESKFIYCSALFTINKVTRFPPGLNKT